MKARLLIIDDDAQRLAAMLEAAGFAAVTASDLSTAMKLLETEAVEAIVLDPMLRGRINGFTMLSFIELDRPDLVERTFLVTALSEQTVLRTAPALMPRLFRKPLDVAGLATAIRNLGSSSASARPAVDSPRVMIIEDDEATAAATAELMAELGYSPDVAENGREAIQRLATAEYEFLIIDLVLPDVDGFSLLQYIEDIRPSLLRRVIVSTGMPNRFLTSLDTKPIRGVLHKPIRREDLGRLLKTA